MVKILKRDQPLYKKLEQIFDLMQKLGVSFDTSNHKIVITEKNKDYILVDLDNSNDELTDMPPSWEYKLKVE